MKLSIYGLDHCTTTQKAIKSLQARGYQFDPVIDIREQPPKRELIEQLIGENQAKIRGVLNTSGELYREMGLKDRINSLSHEEIIDLLQNNGMLIKRPLITDGKKISVSAKDNILNEVWP